MTAMPKIIGAPDKIYLQYGELQEDIAHAEAMRRFGDYLTFCEDRIEDSDVEYIRADLVGWQKMETAPIAEKRSFLVHRVGWHNGYVEEVFGFDGQIYPQREIGGVCWDNRVLDAVAWMPLPSPPKD